MSDDKNKPPKIHPKTPDLSAPSDGKRKELNDQKNKNKT
jgi:hypothetical protein